MGLIFQMDNIFRIVNAFIQDDCILYLMMDLMIWIGHFDLQRIFSKTFQYLAFMMDL
jgi:hypothetical protein